MNDSQESETKRVVLGQIGKVHGIKGWLRLNSFTTPKESILDYPILFAEVGQNWQKFEIDQFKQQGKGLLVHLKGVDDPEAAKQLTGLELSVNSTDLPALEEGVFYWHELEGMTVRNQHGDVFGCVSRLLETGANDVLVIEPTETSIDERERLIPYVVDSVIQNVDADSRIITVNWEADYLE